MNITQIFDNVIEKLKNQIKSIFFSFGYRINRVDTVSCLEPLLYHRLEQTNDFFFVQIGANDGKLADPIYSFVTRNHDELHGIAIEPMRDVFKELCETYKNYQNIQLLNIAIHNTLKEAILYKVDPKKASKLPCWVKGIASFNQQHHALSGTPSDAIIPETVKCLPISELIDRYQIKSIDLLQIDTEGYDIEILSNFDFVRVKPAIIHFEHGLKNGISTMQNVQNIIDKLHSFGYEVIVEDYDITAFLISSVLLPDFIYPS